MTLFHMLAVAPLILGTGLVVLILGRAAWLMVTERPQ